MLKAFKSFIRKNGVSKYDSTMSKPASIERLISEVYQISPLVCQVKLKSFVNNNKG